MINTGPVIAKENAVMVEATSNVPLLDSGRYANRYIFLIHFSGGLVRDVRDWE